MVEKLTEDQKISALTELSGWTLADEQDAITRKFTFANFNEAWGFMTRIAIEAERMDHHPEWLNVWATVDITLSTHECDGLSMRDIALARFIDKIA